MLPFNWPPPWGLRLNFPEPSAQTLQRGKSGGGIALLAYSKQVWAFGLAGALLAAPHVIGAPNVQGYFGVAPPEVAAAFAARVLGTALVVWAALGWIAGHFWASSAQQD